MTSFERYQKKLIEVTDEVKSRPTIDRITEMEELFELGGVDKYDILTIYRNCGFYSWDDYIRAKTYRYPDKIDKVLCVDRKIDAITSNLLIVSSSMA